MECSRKQHYIVRQLLAQVRSDFKNGSIWKGILILLKAPFQWIIWFIVLKLFCGYGEKPLRTAGWILFILLLFTALYYPSPFGWGFIKLKNADWQGLWYLDFITALHFSVVTFATLGYGNIHPVGWPAQMATTIEVMLGYVMFGILLTLVVRKIARH